MRAEIDGNWPSIVGYELIPLITKALLMKAFSRILALAAIAALVIQSPASASLHVTPGDAFQLAQGNEGPGNPAVHAAVASFLGITTTQLLNTQLYKANAGGPEEGSLASSYATTFGGGADPLANSTFTTTYGSGPVVDPSYLLIKDGNHNPIWYLFDISTWDGTSTLSGSNFWPSNGEISHISILGSVAQVPEAATIFVWAGLSGMAFAAVKLRRRTASA